MDKLNKDAMVIDLEHLFDEDEILNKDRSSKNENSTNLSIESKEIFFGLNRIETIVKLFKSRKLLSYEQLSQHSNELKNLTSYYNYYLCLITDGSITINELRFVEYLLIHKLNKLYEKFNLSEWNILFKSARFEQNHSDSLISILKDYEFSGPIKNETSRLSKLCINSIYLDDVINNENSPKIELNYLNKCNEYMCAVFQFENNEFLLAEQLKNQFCLAEQRQYERTPRSKSHAKPTSSLTKRSSSADQNTLKLRRSKIDCKEKQDIRLINDNISAHIPFENNTTCLSEKCILVDSFKFKYCPDSKQINQIINVKSSCKYILLIIYKLMRPINEQQEFQFKYPVKYVQLNEHHLKNASYPVLQNYKLPLSPIIENNSIKSPQIYLNDLAPSSNVFRRMFKRPKSTNRLRTNSIKEIRSDSYTELSVKPAVRNLIDIDMTYEQDSLINNNVSVENFSTWRKIWQPCLFENRLKPRAENFEMLTIYLNDIIRVNEIRTQQLEDNIKSNFYYIEIHVEFLDSSKKSYFRSNIFKITERINDLYQIPCDFNKSEMNLKFYVFKLVSNIKSPANNSIVQLASSGAIEINRRCVTVISAVYLASEKTGSDSNPLCEYNLRLRCSIQSDYYPNSSQVAFELLNFNFVNSLERENDLLELIDSFLKNQKFNEPILIRKLLELFGALNTPFSNDEQSNGSKKNDRRLVKSLLLAKIYESFIRVLENFTESSGNLDFSVILSNFKHQSKQSVNFLLNFLKNQIESLNSDQNLNDKAQTSVYISTMKTFDKLVEIIHILSCNNNKSFFELKYEMNDLIVKLFGNKSLNYSNPERKVIILSNLNYKFIDIISGLFSGTELANLVFTTFLSTSTNINTLEILNEKILSLNVFSSNHQFRDTLTSLLLKNNYSMHEKATSTSTQILSIDQLNFIVNILNYRYKLSKQNLDTMVQSVFKPLIHSLVNQFKLNIDKTNDSESFMVKNFICLVEILDVILVDRTNKSFLDNDKAELNNLFEIFVFYFKCDKFKTKLFNERPKLWLKTNITILKFSKYIQKHLQRFLITTEEVNDYQQRSNGTLSECISSDCLIRSYIDIIFSFIDTPITSFSLSIKMKTEMLQIMQLFWKCLNIRLKRSTSLNEFVLKRVCNTIISNFYYKVFELEVYPDESTDITRDTLCLSPFYSKDNVSHQSYIHMFYENLIIFLNELFLANQISNFDHFKELIMLNLINTVIKRDKTFRKIKFSSCLRNFSNSIISHIENATRNTFQGNSQSVFHLFKICIDFNMLKDDYLLENVSVVEKFLVIYELFKQVNNVSSNNKFFANANNLADSKRKIKMYLLDELYSLHKFEKNHLYMSFIRKEQADLLEWNYNRKSSNESDLKEILYLKSLKKFALNSMHNSQVQSETGTTSISSSLSSCKASSISSYMSSQSSISSDSSGTTSPSSPSLSASSSPISTPSSLSLAASIKYEQNVVPNSYLLNVQSEICKQLSAYYEKLDDTYPKFSRVLNAESKFIQLAAASTEPEKTDESPEKANHHGHLYFRIGIFGSTLATKSICNKYFLYKHHTYEMLSNIQNLMINKISKSVDEQTSVNSEDDSDTGIIHKVLLLHHNQMPDEPLKENTEVCYLQICAVNRLENHRLVDLLDEMVDSKETYDIRLRLAKQDKNAFFYYFDRPFYMTNRNVDQEYKTSHESVENLWIERSLLIVDENVGRFENLTQYEEIKSIFKILLNPVRNAINDINEKTKELKNFIVQFTTNNSQQISQINIMHNLQPLTMRLLGCLDARVNGGLIKYVKELFCQSLASSKQFQKKKFLMHKLYLSIKDQLSILESGLSIHNRILKSVQISESKVDSENESNLENLKHMNQLNEHLVECLKLIELELNQRWSKFSQTSSI